MHRVCLTTECFKDMGIVCQICNGDSRTPSSPKCQITPQKAAHVAPKTNTDTTNELQSDMDHICLTTECFKGTGLVCEICNNNNISNNQDIGASPAQVSSLKARSEDVAGSGTDAAATKETDFDCKLGKTIANIDSPVTRSKLLPRRSQTLKEKFVPSEVLSATTWQEGNKYVCPFCDKKFDEDSGANEHMIEKHGVTRMYKCPVKDCVSGSRTLRTFHRHLIHHHQMNISGECITCPKCSKLFSDAGSMKGHYNSIHKPPVYVTCGVCGVKIRRRNLKRDTEQHKPEHEWYKCSYYGCGKRYAYHSALFMHVQSVHEREKYYIHPCKNCHKKFESPAQAQIHYIACANITRFPCDLCGRSYSQKVHLVSHRRAKHNEQINLMFAN